MKLDATKMKDWEIAEAAEQNMKPFARIAAEAGLKEDELIPIGKRLGKVDFMQTRERLKDAPRREAPAGRGRVIRPPTPSSSSTSAPRTS